MAQFDLVALSSIALSVLALYESYRKWGRKGQNLSLLLLVLAALQTALLLQLIAPWGQLSRAQWTAVLAGGVGGCALGLLNLDLPDYAESATVLISLLALLQVLATSGIIRLP